jgi:CubicO group peptidase (beta-lactamase class C family)
MAALELIEPPGDRASYSQAGYNLTGRIIEKVTDLPYEWAITSLVFEPLGPANSFFTLEGSSARGGRAPGRRARVVGTGRLWGTSGGCKQARDATRRSHGRPV